MSALFFSNRTCVGILKHLRIYIKHKYYNNESARSAADNE